MRTSLIGLTCWLVVAGCGDDGTVGTANTEGTETEGTEGTSGGTTAGPSASTSASAGTTTTNSTTSPGTSDTDSSGVCGDGVIDPGEGCDDGNGDDGDTCPDGVNGTCQLATCGDGVVFQDIEECDDGNQSDGDGCDANCVLESGGGLCGNGVIDAGEGCDDGNNIDGDDCPDGVNGTCQPAACGDGNLYMGVEECDDGNQSDGDGCDASCAWEGTCGDGILDMAEQCDNGAGNDDEAPGTCPGVCRTTCLCPSCGDGVADFAQGETCDDGNTGSGDGCSDMCKVEAADTCGDGNLNPPEEECDDGNQNDGDGCDSACQFELVGQTCGDQVVDAGEKCDDGNTGNGDGCNPTCNFNTQVWQLATNVPGSVITSDGTYLYLFGANSNCQIHRVAIAQCQPGNCTFAPYVGAGGCGNMTDGPGANAGIGTAGTALAFGGGRLYFSDTHTIREVDLSSPQLIVTTIAGAPNRCGMLDGNGLQAVMSDVRAFVYYNDLLYWVEGNMATLRSYDPGTGDVLTLAGQTPNDNSNTNYSCNANLCCGNQGQAVDGYGTNAVMNSPRYITGDNAGNIYIIDTNGNAIRRYNTVTTYLATIVSGNGYNDGVGPAVGMDRPRGITSDGTSVYFGEQNEHTLRQVELGTATTSTFVGVRGCTGPANLAGGVGGDGSQDWGGQCNNNPAVNNKPQFDVGTVDLTFDYGAQAIFAVAAGNRLLRIE